MDVHTRQLGIGVHVNLELREEDHGLGRKTEGNDTGDGAGGAGGARLGRKDDSVEVSETGQDELDEGVEEVIHALATQIDLDTDGDTRSDPPSNCLLALDNLYTLDSVVSSTFVRFTRERTEGHEWGEELALALQRLLDERVELDLLEADDVVRGTRRRGFLAQLASANWRVMPELAVRVLRVELETDLAGLLMSTSGLVLVGHVHKVIAEGVVVVFLEPVLGEFAGDDVDVGGGQPGFGVFAEVLGYARGAAEALEGPGHSWD